MKDRFEKCFKGSKETPPRLIKKEPNIGKAEEHMHKAETNIMAMEKMFENKFFDWTIVTAYYSMYHAVLAALWIIGIDARSHECAVLAFERFYTKQGKVDKQYLEFVDRAKELSKKYSDSLEKVRTLRIKASYGVGEIKSGEAESARANAKNLLIELRKIIHEAKGFEYIKMA